VTWDDHEVDNNYGAELSEENDHPELLLARRAAEFKAYYAHMPLPRRAVRFGPHMRLHAHRAFGDLVSLFMLDQRQYRSLPACVGPGDVKDCPALFDENRSILGGRQEGWLYAGLANARSRWNLLAQGTLVGFDQEPAVTGRRVMTDAWNGFPASRTRLLRFLEEQRIS